MLFLLFFSQEIDNYALIRYNCKKGGESCETERLHQLG